MKALTAKKFGGFRSRIAYCAAYSNETSGVKTRIAFEHTCGKETNFKQQTKKRNGKKSKS
jgi:hypothetical protein